MAGSTKKSSNRHETNALISTVAAACPMHPRDPRPKGMNEPAGGGSSANCPPGSHLDGWNLSGFGPHIEGSLWRTYGDTTISWPAKVHRASQLTKSSLEALIQTVKSLDCQSATHPLLPGGIAKPPSSVGEDVSTKRRDSMGMAGNKRRASLITALK